MKGFWFGLLLGAILGGGGVYAAIEQPWAGGEPASATARDAGPEAIASNGTKRKRGKKRKRRSNGKRNDNEVLGDPIVELSAADRALVWRGQRVALDAKEVDFGNADDGGRSLSQSEIDAGIASRSDAIVACITEARGNAELAATITLEALVEANGRVSHSRIRAPKYLVDNGLHRCVQNEAKAMRFTATGAQTVVSVPFNLR